MKINITEFDANNKSLVASVVDGYGVDVIAPKHIINIRHDYCCDLPLLKAYLSDIFYPEVKAITDKEKEKEKSDPTLTQGDVVKQHDIMTPEEAKAAREAAEKKKAEKDPKPNQMVADGKGK